MATAPCRPVGFTEPCPKAVEPYPLDVLVAESQGMIGYMLAQRLALEPDMPPVTAVLTRIKVSADDPAFLEPEKFIGPVYSPEEQMSLEATYGWHMKRDGKYLRRVVASRRRVRLSKAPLLSYC